MAWAPVARMQTASPKCPGNGAKSGLGHLEAPQQFGEEGPATVCAPCHTCRRALTWMPFSCRFRYRVLTGMLAGTSASSLRVQITRLAWLLQEQAAGHEVAGGEPPPAAKVKATPPPPAPRGGENSQRKSRAPWGQDILPGGSGGHGEPRARAILNVHAPCGRRGAVGDREGQIRDGLIFVRHTGEHQETRGRDRAEGMAPANTPFYIVQLSNHVRTQTFKF